jgi:hypothetical protein
MFRLLVVCQDYGMSVREAREMIGRRFGLDEQQVRGLEREGWLVERGLSYRQDLGPLPVLTS